MRLNYMLETSMLSQSIYQVVLFHRFRMNLNVVYARSIIGNARPTTALVVCDAIAFPAI